MDPVLQRLGEIGVIPVIALEAARPAAALGQALVRGGLPVAEVTFRTAAAEDAIRAMAGEVPELLVGAGTVLTVDQAERAVAAGARFLVSPCYPEAVVAFAQERGIPVLPAVTNPDGVARGLAQGLEVLKFFPAGACGGPAMLDALAGPFGAVRFVPTGGIHHGNLGEYARRPQVLAVGGSWMVPGDRLRAGDWDAVERLCREAVAALHGFAFAQVELPVDTRLAEQFARLFGFPAKDGEPVAFTHGPGRLALRCNQVERARVWLAGMGVAVRPGTAVLDPKGRCASVDLDLELGGLTVRLVR